MPDKADERIFNTFPIRRDVVIPSSALWLPPPRAETNCLPGVPSRKDESSWETTELGFDKESLAPDEAMRRYRIAGRSSVR